MSHDDSRHEDHPGVLKRESRWDMSVVALVIIIIVIVVGGAMLAAVTGYPDLLFALHWLVFVVAICYIAATIYQAIGGRGEDAALSALAAIALLLAWYLTGPQVGWPQPHQHWGHWDPVLLVYLWRGWRQPRRSSCLPVCFIPVPYSPPASFFVIIV